MTTSAASPVLAAAYNPSRRVTTVVLDEPCPVCGGTGVVRSHNPACWDCGQDISGRRFVGRRHHDIPKARKDEP